MRIKAIIFDMDGTLVNTEPVFSEVWETVASRRNRTYTLEMKKHLMGKPDVLGALEYILSEWELEDRPENVLAELNELYTQVLPNRVEPMQGLFELLELLELMKVRIALSTSSPRIWADQVLQSLDITHRFEHIITADDVVHGKPHADAFEIPLQRMGLSPRDVIVIEDSPAGVQSAKAAGIHTIAIKSPFIDKTDVAEADHHIDGLYEINREFIENLFDEHSDI